MSDSQQQQQQQPKQEHQKKKFEGPKRESIINLSQYKDTIVRVKFAGGRLVTGILKGYDELMNLVLDETVEYARDPEDETVILKDQKKDIGLVVIRGTALLSLCSLEGAEIIST
ncbi:Sm-like protein lsm7 [Kluyveromyces marxianus]|uniref:Sm_like super family n=1 Tax=Kluyveromyces marxianus (strain DMKU3-1042 / BCC 29191 / NBRC 104275) TaxID=1003335 RepID=W0T6E8_KLUMD|nr:Sm-like family protein [Kluyveromyces marxianus DMKU3-1042]KAG0679190.1 Sm-like protein lsm7 [Kluyveromyces marxianus]KAG0685089.1 Sm-like protein lsm7 [Kluyveromyces marxianus]BAO38356.1 sm_like super family [Kluyveromyces marxianus DMKU3-1042]